MTDDLRPAAPSGVREPATAGEVELVYRRLPMVADYCRGWAGLGLTALPLFTMQPTWPVALGLSGLVGLFMGFLIQTWRRHRARVLLAPSGIALIQGRERQMAWRDLEGLRLRWFGSRRQGRGWLELEHRGGGTRIVMTSALDRFDDVVAEAVQAANDRGLPLEPATRANVEALLGRAA
jgi:hypothetical protein